MKSPSADYLRLVSVEDDLANQTSAFVSDWPALCQSFSSATGVSLVFRAPMDPPLSKPPVWTTEVPAIGEYASGELALVKRPNSRISKQKLNDIETLANHVGQLVSNLHDATRALKKREAELATAIPLIVRPADEPSQLAARFEAVLRGGAEAIDCHAAAVYLLDDATRFLKLRCHFGLDDQRFTAAPRALRESKADIEALAGHAVVLSDMEQVNEWGVPEKFASAVCVPVSTATIPLGTLWAFSHEVREFTDREVELTEIVAGRMAAELEREILLREQGVLGSSGHVSGAIAWQQALLPRKAPVVGPWEIAARPSARSRLHGDFYQWRATEDNRLALTLTTSYAEGVPAAMTAATLSGLTRQQSDLSPIERLATINATLWEGSNGDTMAAAFCGSLEESSGELEFCAAGMIDAFIIRPHSWETIWQADEQPAGLVESLGDLDLRRGEIHSDDFLLVISGKPQRQPRIARAGLVDAAHYAEAALHHSHLPADEMTTLLASLWESHNSPWGMPPAFLIAKHRA